MASNREEKKASFPLIDLESTLLITDKEGFQRYPNHPLVGVYDKRGGKITLYPCIKEIVFINANSEGIFLSGNHAKYEMIGNDLVTLKGAKIEPSKLAEYQHSKYAPRKLYIPSKTEPNNQYASTMITPHEYMLHVMGKIAEEQYYRGFAVTPNPGGELIFTWVSGALNSARDKNGVRQFRENNATMLAEDQEKVRSQITLWNAPALSMEKKSAIGATDIPIIESPSKLRR